MATETKRRFDVANIEDSFYENVDEDEDHFEVSHELTGTIAIKVGIDARSRIDYWNFAYPYLHKPMDDALKWLWKKCATNDHSLCGMSLEGLLMVMSRTFADAIVDGLKEKELVTKYKIWGDPSNFYDYSPLTPIAPPAPIADDYRIRRATPKVEMACEKMVNRLVDFHGYERDVAEGWVADASSQAAAQLSADLPPANEAGISDNWNVALEWLSRTFALVWQREVRTLPREP